MEQLGTSRVAKADILHVRSCSVKRNGDPKSIQWYQQAYKHPCVDVQQESPRVERKRIQGSCPRYVQHAALMMQRPGQKHHWCCQKQPLSWSPRGPRRCPSWSAFHYANQRPCSISTSFVVDFHTFVAVRRHNRGSQYFKQVAQCKNKVE